MMQFFLWSTAASDTRDISEWAALLFLTTQFSQSGCLSSVFILVQWACSLALCIVVEGSPVRREASRTKQGVELCPSDAGFPNCGLRDSVLWSPWAYPCLKGSLVPGKGRVSQLT